MIEARLRKHFPARTDSAEFTLDVDFVAHSGVTVFFGPSGAGKTLILECIAGFVTPDQGRILVDDRILFDAESRVNVKARQRQCGYVFQNYALFPHMTVRENLEFASAAIPTLERSRRISEALSRFRLTEVTGRRPHELSGGQRQRCSIARALVSGPRVLLLDEPARGLDATLRSDLYSTIRQIQEEFGTPILLVTHDLDECFELGTEMLIVHDGRIVQSGRPAAVCEAPASLEIAHLLGRFNIMRAEIRSLDPGRDTSILRVDDCEIECAYIPGHLKGDHITIAVLRGGLRASPAGRERNRRELRAQLARALEVPNGVRLEFSNGLYADVARAEYEGSKHNRNWLVEIPREALKVF